MHTRGQGGGAEPRSRRCDAPRAGIGNVGAGRTRAWVVLTLTSSHWSAAERHSGRRQFKSGGPVVHVAP